MYYSAWDEGICNIEDFTGSFALKGNGIFFFLTENKIFFVYDSARDEGIYNVEDFIGFLPSIYQN